MGNLMNRQNVGVEYLDLNVNTTYRYPPKNGESYFSNQFEMGGETFPSPKPEAFLFGENSDLNFLNPKPIQFPYLSPTGNEPTKTLRSLLNLRKDTLKLIKCNKSSEGNYHIEFVFDADVKCKITIYYLATENLSSGIAVYNSGDPDMTSPVFHYDKGCGQIFNHGQRHVIKPSLLCEEALDYNVSSESSQNIPVVIHLEASEDDYTGHSNITFATFETTSDGTYAIKPIKQKQMVDGLCYLLEEIYGIENKGVDKNGKVEEMENDETSSECVICMCDVRDTLILPCRHLCLCRSCADSLRFQSSTCPICRSPFHALLQIRPFIKKPENCEGNADGLNDEEIPGYCDVSLFEALNGVSPEDSASLGLIGSSARVRLTSASSSRRSAAGSRKGSARPSSRRWQRSQSRSSHVSVHHSSDEESDETCAKKEDNNSSENDQSKERKSVSAEGFCPEEEENVLTAQFVEDFDTKDLESDEVVKDAEEKSDSQELHVAVDVSLPGTPLSSDTSSCSLASTLSRIRAAQATPSNINLDEHDPKDTSVKD